MKKKWFQKLVATALVVTLAVAAVGCGGKKAEAPAEEAVTEEAEAPVAEETSGEKVTVVVIPKLVHEFYNLVLDGANLAVEELAADGKEVEIIWSAPSTADTVEQAEKFEAAIALKPDYIAIAVIDGEGMRPLMEQAQAEGIKIIAFDTDFEGSPADAFVGCTTDAQYESGRTAADQMVEMIGKEEGKIAMLIGSPDAENHILFSGGFRDRLAEAHPGYEIVTEQADNDDKEKATQLSEAILAQYPDVDGIFGGNGSAGVGAGIALSAAIQAGQIEDGQVVISNYCLMPEPQESLEKGEISFIMDYSPYWIGYYLTQIAAAEKLDGKPLQDVNIEFAVVTQENLDGYDYSKVSAADEYWK